MMKTKYIELPLLIFCQLHPEIFDAYPFVSQMAQDPLYIVRYTPDMHYIEFGYKEDKWHCYE